MSWGTQITANQINADLSNIQKNLNTIDMQITDMFNALEAISDATLEAAPYGYSTTDVAQLRSAYRDIYHLMQVRKGLWFVASGATAGSGVPTANGASTFGYDFTAFAKLGADLGF